MNTHLSEEQISNCIAGAGTAEEVRHGSECELCHEKFVSFQLAVASFRCVATDWADHQGICYRPVVPKRMRVLPWVAAAAAAVTVLAAIPAYKKTVEQEREAKAAQESQLDTQLLERVNAHLSRTAPAPLQPLMVMLSATDPDTEGDRQ